jgi:hypothetical protein
MIQLGAMMTKISSVVSICLAASMLSACAQNSKEIGATYVSPNRPLK